MRGRGLVEDDSSVSRIDAERAVRATLDEYSFFDDAITDHGFTQYNRDYRLVAEIYSARRGRGTELEAIYTFLFRGCVEAHYRSEVPIGFSMDEVLLDLDRANAAGDPGFVWGVNHAVAYPGLTYIGESARTREWESRLGILMHEVLIETNTYSLRLVFHDVTVAVEDALAP